MTEKQKIILWVAVGLCGAAIVVYLGMRGSFITPTENGTIPTSSSSISPKEMPVQGTIEVPKRSEPISVTEIPAKAIKISVSASGFSPNSFTVDAGDKIILAITSGDQYSHTFSFNNPVLSNLSVGVGAGETRTIEFTAPAKGESTFQCGLPGHADRGETGKMIVK
ncbi:MAG: cupredoxin domain-containing protein [Candidatus Paceibacterota bacterium]|jgi:uncharacterized cupredoxin-like copper-binding protein